MFIKWGNVDQIFRRGEVIKSKETEEEMTRMQEGCVRDTGEKGLV